MADVTEGEAGFGGRMGKSSRQAQAIRHPQSKQRLYSPCSSRRGVVWLAWLHRKSLMIRMVFSSAGRLGKFESDFVKLPGLTRRNGVFQQ